MSMMNRSAADSVRPAGRGGTMLPQVRARMRLSPDRISRTVLITVYGDGQPRSSMRYAYHTNPAYPACTKLAAFGSKPRDTEAGHAVRQQQRGPWPPVRCADPLRGSGELPHADPAPAEEDSTSLHPHQHHAAGGRQITPFARASLSRPAHSPRALMTRRCL
jgi:hypothetical protein